MLATLIHPQPAMRTFVFQQEQTQQSIIIEHEIDLRLNFIDLNRLLGQYCPPLHHRIAIYDPNLNYFVRFDNIGAENGYLHRDYLEPRIVLIRYRKRYSLINDSDSVDSSLEPDSQQERKDGRSKERTIAEVIELVKKWRNLHLHGHKAMRRRLNLQDAAKLVGISKKSLDDYYCQLRLGEFYEFDFACNLHEKIGVLRNFVKQHKDKNPTLEQKRKQNQKYPKNLKVIDQFQLQTKSLLIPEDEEKIQPQAPSFMEMNQQQPQHNFLIDPLDELHQNSNHVYQELFNLEHDFFKGFQLALDDANDPYNEIHHDFRKKEYQEQSNSFLYF